MFKLAKKEESNLLQLAKDNIKKFESRMAKYIINELNKKIEDESFKGDISTYYDFKFNEYKECGCLVKSHYEKQGFKVDLYDTYIIINWEDSE